MSTPMPLLVRGDARRLPLPDASVDCIVTSPPYFGLRDYRDHDGSMAAQIGAEQTPREFVDALVACTAEWARVLKPSGSMFVNLGDKYAERSGPARTGGVDDDQHLRRPADRPARGRRGDVPVKSLLMLPERYRIAVVDELRLIARAVIVWSKPNGMPESVTDRVRRSHEDWVHLVKRPRYYQATDDIREQHTMRPQRRPSGRGEDLTPRPGQPRQAWSTQARTEVRPDGHPLGKLPGSVWDIPTQPLNVPDHVVHARCCGGTPRKGCRDGLNHYAAFPTAWPRRLITGWCPREVCTACGEGRHPVGEVATTGVNGNPDGLVRSTMRLKGDEYRRWRAEHPRTITGTACGCPDTSAPTRPGVVLDPFSGTGTTALVATMLGRTGIGVDLSHAYTADLARWRAGDPRERARAAGADPDAVAAIRQQQPGQLDLLAADGA